MKIGFTGTREGMTGIQKQVFLSEVRKIVPLDSIFEFRHGDCVGADEEAHNIISANFKKAVRIIHPPDIDIKRAFCKGEHILLPKAYIFRDKDIVNSSNLLFACPNTQYEKLRSGTWTTVRYAKAIDRKITIIFPNGKVDFYGRL